MGDKRNRGPHNKFMKQGLWGLSGIEKPPKEATKKEKSEAANLARRTIRYNKIKKFFEDDKEVIVLGLIILARIKLERRKEKGRIRFREYYQEHKGEISVRKKAARIKPENKKKRNKKLKERRRKDPVFKLESVMRSSMANSFRKRGWEKKARTEEIIGLPFDEFIAHLISHPDWEEEHFTLENHGKTWHIDHEYAISNAKTEDDVIALNHYTNLKPMWATTDIAKAHGVFDKIGNLNKGNRLEE